MISAVKTYLASYTGLKSGAPIFIDQLDPKNPNYAIISLAGDRVLERYLDGSSVRQFVFAVRSMESTADELERIETSGFYEALADWFESQTDLGVLPTLASGKTCTALRAEGWAYLYETSQSSTGIYQIQCILEYEQEA
jgi:hypothetical protein